MLISYPANYRDEFGEEITTIYNDGKTLRIKVRGVEFIGTAFDLLTPPIDFHNLTEKPFYFFLDALYACEINCEVPVKIIQANKTFDGMIKIHVELGMPDGGHPVQMLRKKDDGSIVEENSAPSKEILILELIFDNKHFKSSGVNFHSSFDEQLAEIKKLLPEDTYIKTCWNCAFADYHPVGSGSFGGLACFKNTKEDYRNIKSKFDLMHLWDKRADSVQEIHLCPEFEKRIPGMGGLYVG